MTEEVNYEKGFEDGYKKKRKEILKLIENRRKQDVKDLDKEPKKIHGEILEELHDKFDDDLANEIFSLLTMRGRDMYIEDLKGKLKGSD